MIDDDPMQHGVTTVEIGLFGSLRVTVGDDLVEITGDRQRRLLARLALARGRAVSRSVLADAVWGGEDAPSDPDTGIRTYVGRLRRSLGDHAGAVQTSERGYVLSAAVATDVARFETHVRRGRARAESGESDRAIRELGAALELSRRPLLEPWAGEAWVLGESERLIEMRLSAAALRAELQVALGHHDRAVEELTPLTRAHPHHEGVAGRLAAALHAQGRAGDALGVIAECRRRLGTDLGLDPGRELVDLEASILDQRPVRAPAPRRLRSYELGERIGEGSFSIVYRGRQPAVDRDVAIKVIRAELANEADFVRRFETEARLVARLEHPHIVPLYDFWREPDAAYLVMRWLRGGTVHSRLSDRPLSLDETARLVTDVGDALTFAHANGVVHRDVKPANVFLDDDGRFYLGDFGIAVDAQFGPDPVAALSLGSPAYAAPEQLQRRSVGVATDVYGLAVTVYEALAGHLPFADARSHAELLQRQLEERFPTLADQVPGLPPEVDAVIASATAKDPAERTVSIASFVSAFREAASPDAQPRRQSLGSMTLVGDGRNPYVGLAAFDEGDADRFFGRSRLTTEVVDRIREQRMVMVVGPSGSGKSSLVRAGVLPRIRTGALPGSQRWFVVTMTPGDDPYDALEAALLRVAVNPPASLREQLLVDDRGISRCVRRALPDDDGELLLVIDQFEELFTLCEDEEIRRRFLRALVHAVADERVRVVSTIRADHYDRPLRHAELGRIVREGTIPITPLAPDEMERVIVDPATRAGVEFEPGLVPTIVAEVNDQPGALPLLQFTLTQLWDRQVSGVLTMEAYRELGGVSGSLAAEAERLYLDLDPDERVAARSVFQRLVTPGEGRGDTRRRALRSELEALDHGDAVLEAFGAARLLHFDRDDDTRRPTVEVAHEALLREWPRLAAWIDDDRDGLRIHRHLTAAAAGWAEHGRDPSELYRGGRLEAAVEHARDAHLTDEERAFLDASTAAGVAAVAVERRRVTRLRALATVTGVIAVVALVAGVVAIAQQRRADDNANDARAASARAAAEAERANLAAAEAVDQAERAETALADAEIATLISRSLALSNENPTASLLLAVEAYDREQSNRTTGALAGALRSRVGETLRVDLEPIAHRHCEEGAPAHSDYLPASWDGRVGWYRGGEVVVIDPTDGVERVLTVQPDPCGGVFWAHSAGPIVHVTDDAVLVERVPGSGQLSELTGVDRVLGAIPSASADGPVLVVSGTSGPDARLDLYGGDDQLIAGPMELAIGFGPVALSPSGRHGLVASATRNEFDPATVQIFDASTGVGRWTADVAAQVTDVAFAPDDSAVAVADSAATVLVFDVETGETISVITTDTGTPTGVTFLDPTTVAVATGPGVEVWNVPGRTLVRWIPLSGADTVRAIDGSRITVVTNGDDEMVVLDLSGSGIATSLAEVRRGARVFVNAEGIAAVASIGSDEATTIDLQTGETRRQPGTVPGAGIVVGYAPGRSAGELWAFTGDGVIAAIDDDEIVGMLRLVDDPAYSIRQARGHRTGRGTTRVAIQYSDPALPDSGRAFLVDLEALEVVVAVDGLPTCLCGAGITPSPDGEALVIDHGSWLEIHTGAGEPRVIEGLTAPVSEASINHAADPVGNRLLRGLTAGVVELVGLADGSARVVGDFGSAIDNVAFVDERQAAVVTDAGEVWLIDLASGERVGLVWEGGSGDDTAGSPMASADGSVLWVPTSTEIVEVPLDPDAWRALACRLAGRDLTDDEWRDLVPGDREPRTLCDAAG